MDKVIGIFRALSDLTRFRIYYLLVKSKKEIAVCELIDALKESQYNISKHLKILKNAGIVSENKKGRWVLYRIAKPPVNNLENMVGKIRNKQLSNDYEMLLKRLSLREKGRVVSCSISKKMKRKGGLRNGKKTQK